MFFSRYRTLLLICLWLGSNVLHASSKPTKTEQSIQDPDKNSDKYDLSSGVVPKRTIRAERTNAPMYIDGKGDEPVWNRAPISEAFIERTPVLGQTPHDLTTFQVAYDTLAIYILVRSQKPAGAPLRSSTLRRDSVSIFSDDTITVKIDPQHDHQTAYSFSVNPDGAQIDALVLNNGRNFILAWDGIWEAEVREEETAYVVEMRIPFAIMGVGGHQVSDMGLNINRSRNGIENFDWRLIIPPLSPMTASTFGDIVGLKGIRSDNAIDFVPYSLMKTDFTPDFNLDPTQNPNFTAGTDIRVKIGAFDHLEFSLLTDFAQVEVDEIQVANNRFPLFFPEKRPFFVRGLQVFQFGVPAKNQLFFSRRIGLIDGEPIPILSGMKWYGTTDNISYGFINVQTLSHTTADSDGNMITIAPQNFSIMRAKAQLDNWIVGGLFAEKLSLYDDAQNHSTMGVDMEYRGDSGRLRWYNFLAGTNNDELSHVVSKESTPNDTSDILWDRYSRFSDLEQLHHDFKEANPLIPGMSAHSSIDYRSLYFRPTLSWTWSDSSFSPEQGYFRRTNVAEHEAKAYGALRPNFWGIQELVAGPRLSVTTDPYYTQLVEQDAAIYAKVSTTWGGFAFYEYGRQVDSVAEDFTLYSIDVEADEYVGNRHVFFMALPSAWMFFGALGYEYSDLYDGQIHKPGLSLSIRPARYFFFNLQYQHPFGYLGEQDSSFNFGFANCKTEISLTRALLFDTAFRFSMAPDSETFGVQSRLRWQYRPGSDLFLVYRYDQPFGLESNAAQFEEPFHEVTLKVTFYSSSLVPKFK
jgi:hypothetical protein